MCELWLLCVMVTVANASSPCGISTSQAQQFFVAAKHDVATVNTGITAAVDQR